MRIGTAYFGNRMLKHVAADMKRLKREGFNTIIHTFSENDFKFYRQSMKEIVEVTHEAGHEVYIDPWGVGQVFGGEAFSVWAQTHAHDGCQMLDDGNPAGIACPNHAGFRAFMKEWIDAAAETGSDVAFWDEPHFYLSHWMIGRPNTWGCRCAICQQMFREKYDKPMPKTETDEVKAFKFACLLDFVKFLVKASHKAGMKNALCVLPYDEPDVATKRWLPFAKIPNLQVFGTDPYWCHPHAKQGLEMVAKYSKLTMDVCEKTGKEAQIWIQGFMIPDGREGEVGQAIADAAAAGVKNLAVWGVDACAHLSHIRPANPEKVWRTVVQGFKKAARGQAR